MTAKQVNLNAMSRTQLIEIIVALQQRERDIIQRHTKSEKKYKKKIASMKRDYESRLDEQRKDFSLQLERSEEIIRNQRKEIRKIGQKAQRNIDEANRRVANYINHANRQVDRMYSQANNILARLAYLSEFVFNEPAEVEEFEPPHLDMAVKDDDSLVFLETKGESRPLDIDDLHLDAHPARSSRSRKRRQDGYDEYDSFDLAVDRDVVRFTPDSVVRDEPSIDSPAISLDFHEDERFDVSRGSMMRNGMEPHGHMDPYGMPMGASGIPGAMGGRPGAGPNGMPPVGPNGMPGAMPPYMPMNGNSAMPYGAMGPQGMPGMAPGMSGMHPGMTRGMPPVGPNGMPMMPGVPEAQGMPAEAREALSRLHGWHMPAGANPYAPEGLGAHYPGYDDIYDMDEPDEGFHGVGNDAGELLEEFEAFQDESRINPDSDIDADYENFINNRINKLFDGSNGAGADDVIVPHIDTNSFTISNKTLPIDPDLAQGITGNGKSAPGSGDQVLKYGPAAGNGIPNTMPSIPSDLPLMPSGMPIIPGGMAANMSSSAIPASPQLPLEAQEQLFGGAQPANAATANGIASNGAVANGASNGAPISGIVANGAAVNGGINGAANGAAVNGVQPINGIANGAQPVGGISGNGVAINGGQPVGSIANGAQAQAANGVQAAVQPVGQMGARPVAQPIQAQNGAQGPSATAQS